MCVLNSNIYLCKVKRTIQIVQIFFLLALYCFALGANHSYAFTSDQINSDTQNEGKFSSLSSNLYCLSSPSENTANNFTNFQFPTLKNQNNGQWAFAKIFEELFVSRYYQYQSFSIRFLIQLRKTSFIFPFHYFL